MFPVKEEIVDFEGGDFTFSNMRLLAEVELDMQPRVFLKEPPPQPRDPINGRFTPR